MAWRPDHWPHVQEVWFPEMVRWCWSHHLCIVMSGPKTKWLRKHAIHRFVRTSNLSACLAGAIYI